MKRINMIGVVAALAIAFSAAQVLAEATAQAGNGSSKVGAFASLRVIYAGPRALEFEPFLKENFTTTKAVGLNDFRPEMAEGFDVVMLDWPQSMRNETEGKVPLGERTNWKKPTVLVGSAGLNLAIAWKLKGGSGCTCLAPVAYDLRDHEIFRFPIAIDMKPMTNIPTPVPFQGELKVDRIPVLPVVDGIRNFNRVIEENERGWSTHYYEFATVPDVEIFCGGINEQTPASSAFWRQGNLLHFGFEQSPAQLNATGKAMLLNGIVYISRFTEDRPIDITPSVFGKEKIGTSRRRARNMFLRDHPNWATNYLSAATLASFAWSDPQAGKAWAEANWMWLHPGANNMLEIDKEARELGVPFDSPEFLEKAVSSLRDPSKKEVAITLLCRYAPEGPGASADADTWDRWLRENSQYLFYSELGCYQWYIDPLAKKRHIPTTNLRGVARADAPGK